MKGELEMSWATFERRKTPSVLETSEGKVVIRCTGYRIGNTYIKVHMPKGFVASFYENAPQEWLYKNRSLYSLENINYGKVCFALRGDVSEEEVLRIVKTHLDLISRRSTS